jgi:NTE family protein
MSPTAAGASGNAALVLAGGGARGAYEFGALSVLLPRLKGQVKLILGTSVGAFNAAYLAANWEKSAQRIVDGGARLWRGLHFEDVLAPVVSPGGLGRFLRYVGEFLAIPRVDAPSLLDPKPLPDTLRREIRFEQLNRNVDNERLSAIAVVATGAYTNRSIVFHRGGVPHRPQDPERAIDHVPTAELEAQHVLASGAIPGVFPAVRVTVPEAAAGWYSDGGTRLNTPIKPALWLGAERVIVIALNAVTPTRTPPPDRQPDFFAGAAQLAQAVLGDPLAQDVRTLARKNELARADVGGARGADEARRGGGGARDPLRPVPYIFVAPEDPDAIGKIAREVYNDSYASLRRAPAARDLWLLGHSLNAGEDPIHGELLSYLFFAPEFAEALLRQGQLDAQRWIDEHPGLWTEDPLPEWSRAEPLPSALR